MNTSILDEFEKTVKRFPDKTAFFDENDKITFLEIQKKAKVLASIILENQIEGEPIVVLVDKSVRVPAYYLASVYSGNFYVPISTEHPKARIKTIVETVQARVIITELKNINLLEDLGFAGQVIVADSLNKTETNENKLTSIRCKIVDYNPLYVIFTSGSTGIPKGVVASQKAVIDYIYEFANIIDLNDQDIMGNQSPFDYDGSIRDIYFTLFFGVTTYIIPKGYFSLPVKLFESIEENKVTCISWAVSAISLPVEMGAFDFCIPHHLRRVMFAGSAMPCKHLKIWQEKLPDTVFINHYGPTEATGTCTYYKVDHMVEENENLPIGKPFVNSKILIIDKNGQKVKHGDIGEICIGGNGIAYGYYNNNERTKDSFVQNPLNDRYPEIIYKTGDLGYYRKDGELMFKGREDFQIKHMGHRIELEEIESNAKELLEIDECYCVYRKEKQKIGLFYKGNIEKREIAIFLRERLPDYMIPRKITKIETFPMKLNGKVDLEKLRLMI